MVTMKDLLECGVHFGHQTRRWNPKMKKFIFGVRKNIHIIDLQKTLRYFRYTYNVVRDAASEGKVIMFVGTKKQASDTLREYAEKVNAPYVNYRWLGGMLTNFSTIKKSVRKLEIIEEMESSGQIDLLTKKEKLMLLRKKEKLNKYLGGIRHLKKAPDMLFVVDALKERIAVGEARKLGIPVVAPLDTNCDPDGIDYVIPGNDDATKSISMILGILNDAVVEAKGGLPQIAYSKDEGEEVTMKDAIRQADRENALRLAARREMQRERLEKEKARRNAFIQKKNAEKDVDSEEADVADASENTPVEE